jgi:hypothetical protein
MFNTTYKIEELKGQRIRNKAEHARILLDEKVEIFQRFDYVRCDLHWKKLKLRKPI